MKWWKAPWLQKIFSPQVTVICLGFLFVLTFWGTLYQVDHGLHAAQVRFFQSYIILLGGFIPFPGAQLVLGVLLLNVLGYTLNLVFFEPLRVGILTMHLGILILLLGGAIIRYHAEEGYLSLWEGEGSNVASSYTDWELAVLGGTGAVKQVTATDVDASVTGDSLRFDPPGLTLSVDAFFPNARAFTSPDADIPWRSSAGISRIEPTRQELDPVQNVAGAILTVTKPDQSTEQLVLFGEDALPITIGDTTYTLALRHRRMPLPLYLTLLDFQRVMHPGTEVAREFSSQVEVSADGSARILTISMNKPLRHRGFTLFQQSYQELPNGAQSSTFAVAKNYGRLLPYYSTGIIVLGMILHFGQMLVQRARRNTRRGA
ncbi:MAG: cytochrome c biogenesis protein ResB [Kiritimatiellae bacterium]|nr:cytochrome c biogenesis protein ResB [Kiritimatiellia bacterium]MCB1101766.1 cytochrome c biogenesis protein ResB [Kiritimatiellia bacterium]